MYDDTTGRSRETKNWLFGLLSGIVHSEVVFPMSRTIILYAENGGEFLNMEKCDHVQKHLRNNALYGPSLNSGLQSQRLSPKNEQRQYPRNYPYYRTLVYDATDVRCAGLINDITESGIQVAGIPVKVQESKKFVVNADACSVHSSFVFDAQCVWTKNDPYGDCIAGFMITGIQKRAVLELRKFIQCLSFCEK
jgi:hypothetical protein